jgi:uncharacterized membrane protein
VQVPSAPIAIAFPLLISATVFALAYRGFRVHGALSLIEVLLVSAAAAVAAFVVVVALVFGMLSPTSGALSAWLFVLPLAVYAVALFLLTRRFRISNTGTLVGGALTLVPLWFVVMYAGLFVACAFGECI